MKASTVAPADEDLELVAGNVRAVMARARVSASDLSRRCAARDSNPEPADYRTTDDGINVWGWAA